MGLPNQRPIISHTAAATLSRGFNTATGKYDLSPAIHNNTGATGSVTITLPATAEVGDVYDFDVTAAQALVIYAGTSGVFINGSTTGTAGQSLRQSGTLGASVQVVCTAANQWQARLVNGTFTIS